MWGILGSQALQATVGVLKERIAGFAAPGPVRPPQPTVMNCSPASRLGRTAAATCHRRGPRRRALGPAQREADARPATREPGQGAHPRPAPQLAHGTAAA